MTVANTSRKAGPFLGNGATTSFPFTFKVFEAGDIALTHVNADGVPTALVLNSHYSVTLNADQNLSPGGTITYPLTGAALATGEKLVGIGALEATQPTDIANSGRMLPQVHEDAYDRDVILVQQLLERMGRTLTSPPWDVATIGELPSSEDRAGMFLSFDAQGNPVAASGTGGDAALRADLAASGGSALVGFLQAGAGAVVRTEQNKMRDAVSLKDFGAVGDDVANDTAAVNAWLTYISTNGKTGFVPAGKYRITAKVAITGTTNFSIIGDGQELSQFIFEGGDVGFDLYAPSRTDANGGACVLSMFSVLKRSDVSTWGGTAIKFTTGTEAAGNPSMTLFIHGVSVGGAKGDTTYNMRFTHGIHLKSCLQAQLSNVFVVGAIPLNTSVASAGIWFEDSTGCRVVNMHCFRFQRGYYVSGSTEGPTLTACHAVGTQDGIVVDGPSTTDPSNPGLDVSKSHFNVQRYAIRATNRAQGIIEGCLFYEFQNTTETVYKAIWADGVSRMWVIAGNVFTNKVDGSAATKYAIHFEGTSQNQINNNIIRTGNLTYGVVLGADVTRTYVLDNSIDGIATPANAFVNNATDKTSIRYRSARAGGTPYNTWGLDSAALAIPNATATLLSFLPASSTGQAGVTLAASTSAEDGAVVTNARMVVPEYATRIRVSGGLSWDANATGTRTVEVFLNGASVRGLPAIRTNATSALSSQMSFASSPIDVVSGDRITIKVTQTSGASLNLQSSTRCYATVEVLA